MINIRSLIKLSRPLYLLFTAITFTLGSGLARYLGKHLDLAAFILGIVCVIALQTATFLLVEYFRLPVLLPSPGMTQRQHEQSRAFLLQVSAAALVLAVAMIVILLHTRLLDLETGFLLILIFLFLLTFAIPPLRLSESGYGELILAVYFATLIPALAFLLQAGAYHRLLAMTTFPLTLLALAYLLVQDFPGFAADQKFERHTLLTRMTWQHAIPIHHLLVISAYLLFAAAPLFGYPWGLVWPVFLVLPFAGVQVFWLQRIANGGRTYWRFLSTLAASVFGLTAYLLAFTFWIR